MRGKLNGLVIAAVTVALILTLSVTSSAAPETGVDIVVTTSGTATTIDAPGCLNFDGGVRTFDIIARTGAWVSNGFDPNTASWVTLVSNGTGTYRLVEWRALHICGGTDANEALVELRKIDEGGYTNPRIIVNPVPASTATPTVTQTRTPSPTATATRTCSPTVTQTPVATGTPTATATTVPGATSTPTPGTFASVNVTVKTVKGARATVDTPGCLNYDTVVDGWLTQAVSLSGVWVSNGQQENPRGGCCDGPYETLWGANTGFYELSWRGFHICAGRSLEEALAELAKIDPGGAENPLRRVYPSRGLYRVSMPVILK